MQDHADYTTNKKNPAYTTINCLYCIGLQFQSLMRHFRFGGTFSLVSKITINQSINQSVGLHCGFSRHPFYPLVQKE